MDTEEVLISIACAAIIIGVVWYRRDFIFFRWRSVETEGTITNWMSATEKGVRYFYPIIEFRLKNGTAKSFRAEERCANTPMYERGSKVMIRYLEKNPDELKVIFPKKNHP